MKKILLLLLIAVGGYLVWRKIEEDRLEADLWNQATDLVA